MSSGWVSVYRKIFQNPIVEPKGKYTRMEAWIYLLCRANHSDGKVLLKGNLCKFKRGEVITSQQKLMHTFKWGNTKVINFLKLLQEDEMIDVKTTGLGTIVSICNYDTYQDNQSETKVKTKSKQSADKVQTTTMNNKNNKNKIIIKNLKEETYSDINLDQYGKRLLDAFYGHWTEPLQTNGHPRYTGEKTWKTSLRLTRWANNDYDDFYKAHKDEKFRRNQNKPKEVIPVEDIATPTEAKEILGETQFKLRSM